MERWLQLLRETGFQKVETREPLHPATGRPASVIFIALL
jgi:hypothetical protein